MGVIYDYLLKKVRLKDFESTDYYNKTEVDSLIAGVGWWEDSFNAIWNSWSAKTIDWSTSNNQSITISEATTLTQSNLPNWQTNYLKITNWGNYTVTWAWTINWVWETAPVLSEDWVDFVIFKNDWTNTYGDYTLNLDTV